MTFLPYGRQSIDQSDIDAVVEALKSDFLTTGPMVERFERELADFTGAKEAIVVANGTAALHIAVLSQNLGPKDVVIVPSITFVATANAVAFCGAKVVLADVDPTTGLITDEGFDDALEIIKRDYPDHRFAGVHPVHYAGRAIDISHIAEISKTHEAYVLEDACHALGTKGSQGMIGACQSSDMAVFSFHPVKTLTTGEGGAITLNDVSLARRLKALRSHGLERDTTRFTGLGYEHDNNDGPWVYEMQELGYNYRLPDLNCALGVAQMKRLPHFIERRQKLVSLYQVALSRANLPVSWTAPAASNSTVFHLMAIQIDFAALGVTRTNVMAALKGHGIGTQVHYIPVHAQPYWRRHALGQRPLPGADRYYENTLSLPLYADMGDEDPQRVVDALTKVLS
jgi:UDP-4-amino-4,6-dideoxy-N-acetyl-beta-L-altrosamine transaminase